MYSILPLQLNGHLSNVFGTAAGFVTIHGNINMQALRGFQVESISASKRANRHSIVYHGVKFGKIEVNRGATGKSKCVLIGMKQVEGSL